jgi:hypothetical protein
VKPSDWQRTTAAVTASSLPADLLAAIRARAEAADVGDLVAVATTAVVTTSVQEKRRLGRSKRTEQRCGVIVTPDWLVWAVSDDGDAPVVTLAHLSRIEVVDYASSPLAALVADTGLTVSMPAGGSADTPLGSAFIGLGPEGASAAFTKQLADATRAAGGVVRLG